MKSFYTFIISIILLTQINNINSQSALCEQFSSTTFPPTGWTLQFSGTQYWIRSTYSAFNIGVGSAAYDMWNAPTGVIQSLYTPVFQSTVAGDSLAMDMSYSSVGIITDSLIILVSTNGGTTYNALIRFGYLQLQTCPYPCSSGLVWVKRLFWLPAGTNRIQFLGRSGFGNVLYLDSICIKQNLIGIGNNSGVVTQYSLEQNYPNPFNPSTSIKFSIPKSTDVKLVITDVIGREVKVLINEFKTAGSYDINFDASELSSGIYFYRLEAGTYTETKKMLLIK